jgi:hypothetical protein
MNNSKLKIRIFISNKSFESSVKKPLSSIVCYGRYLKLNIRTGHVKESENKIEKNNSKSNQIY